MLIQSLTISLSEGTRDKKSRSSLFGMALGARSFLVNLLIPGKEGQTENLKPSNVQQNIHKFYRPKYFFLHKYIHVHIINRNQSQIVATEFLLSSCVQ